MHTLPHYIEVLPFRGQHLFVNHLTGQVLGERDFPPDVLLLIAQAIIRQDGQPVPCLRSHPCPLDPVPIPITRTAAP